MSGTTITAEATAADLRAELRELVDLFDTAASLDDLQRFADAVTQRLRRARGRINRIVKASAPPAPVVEPKPAAEAPKPAAKVERPAAPPPPAAAMPRETAPAAAAASPRPAPRRITAAHVLVAVLTSWWSTADTYARHHGRRARRVVKRTRHRVAVRTARLSDAIRSTLARIGGAS